MNIEEWLARVGAERHAAAFEREELTVEDLDLLTEADLIALGIPMGPRRRILREVRATDVAPQPPAAPVRAPIGAAERRTMSVVFCDLVGSTVLSTQLDPEDLHAVMVAYQDAITAVFTDHGGHVAKYLGDGTLIYFGWPVAHQDQAERAVRAALAAVVAAAELNPDGLAEHPLACRVGIATGPVVIGDVAGEANAIVGETPNLAARLESVAPTGAVVVDAATAGLVEHAVDLDALGSTELKGIPDPVEVFAVRGVTSAPSRFAAAAAVRSIGPFVGREAELGLLSQAWDRVRRGEGAIVTIGGEAGIGKSRLVHEFLASPAVAKATSILLQCDQDRRSAAFHPFVAELRRHAGLDATTTPTDRSSLDELASRLGGDPDEDTDLLAELLLDADIDDRTTPEERNIRVRQLLTRRLERALLEGPTILVVEDLHWADPSTSDLMREIGRQAGSAPLLVVCTHRHEWEPIFRAGTATSLSLGAIDAVSLGTLARAIAPGLDVDKLDGLVATTQGNPLYVEQFARDADQGAATIPTTLEASLLGRLDRLGDTRDVARAAAVVGAGLTVGMAASMLGRPSTEVEDDLAALVAADVLAPATIDGVGSYGFVHALLRQVAYENLTRRDRRELHRRAADHLEGRGGAEPDVLATHRSAAEQWEQSIPQWRAAGARAGEFGSAEEAVVLYRRALDDLAHLPEGDRRTRIELELLLELAPLTMNLRGHASDKPYGMYRRAGALAAELGDPDAGFMAAWGATFINEVRGDFARGSADIQRLLAIDRSTLAADLPIQIDHAAFSYYSVIGYPLLGIDYASRVIEQHDPALHANHHRRFVHDPLCCALNARALASLQTGQPAVGPPSLRLSRERAQHLGHPPTIAQSYWFEAWWLESAGLFDRLREVATVGLALAKDHQVRSLVRSFELLSAQAMEDRAAAYAALRGPIDHLRERDWAGFTIPVLAAMLGELAIEAGELEHALVTLQFGQRVAEQIDERSSLGRLHAARGRALAAAGDLAAAESEFRIGLSFSDERSQRVGALRNAAGLAELLADHGRTDDARAMLAERLAAIDGGEDLPLFAGPRRLLESLS